MMKLRIQLSQAAAENDNPMNDVPTENFRRNFLKMFMGYILFKKCYPHKKLDFSYRNALIPNQLEMELNPTTHVPIMVDSIMEAFRRSPGRRFLDGTLGGGGHTRAILETFQDAEVIALDRDRDCIERAAEALPTSRLTLCHGNFRHLLSLNLGKFDGILLDLGVSSDQLDRSERGFSFRLDAPLDMRMDRSQGWTAAEFLETASMNALIRAVRDFGEEPHWKRVVEAIIQARGTGKLQRTGSFAEFLHRLLPRNFRQRIDSATRTFQGIRIAINGELDALQDVLPQAIESLEDGGILAVLTFHSLEDRLVKQHMRRWSGLPENRFDGRFADERVAIGEMLSAKPILPLEAEICRNPRSRCAKLRLFRRFPKEKIGGASC